MISICIPAYKRISYLRRLLDSIAIQTFTDFEVIISDDSPDETVNGLVTDYDTRFTIRYFKNITPLGMPANWNFVISHAQGDWIKLMHDDDWFSSSDSLQQFANKAALGPKFIFCAYTNVFGDTGSTQVVKMQPVKKSVIINEPLVLMSKNFIGPPSVTMVHKSISESYDERMKWRVDIDFYIRVLHKEKAFIFIDNPLINVGISSYQVTNECFENPLIELPEGLLLLDKYGTAPLKNITVYDAWWRLLRNMNITATGDLIKYSEERWPDAIIKMLKNLSKAPPGLLKIGIISKIFMFISFLSNRVKGIL